MNQEKKLSELFKNFYNIIVKLRSPEGCPWDREQTASSMRMSLIEEAYEIIEAIEKKDNPAIAEELGDLLLNISLIIRIKEEEKSFTYNDVLAGISEKLIRRHPHVFSDVAVKDSKEVVKNWDQIKKQEKSGKSPESILQSIPSSYPPLEKAFEIQKKVSKVGFDWKEALPAWEKVQEEIAEIKEALEQKNQVLAEEEMGDLFFSLVNVSRLMKINPVMALNKCNIKFQRRFQKIEKICLDRNLIMAEMGLEELDLLWDEVKAQEKNKSV